MKIIPQISMFGESENKNFLGDLERLQKVIDFMPDGKIIRKLRQIRGNGRNEWEIEPMWNAFLASFVFEHRNIADLLRELNRNSQLREICGFKARKINWKSKEEKIMLAPTASSFSNFLKNVQSCQKEIKEAFEELTKYMYENLETFGETLMIDGKAIQSYATKNSNNKKAGNRGEKDADWAKKEYTTYDPKGEKVTKTVKWFGFRLHLIADAKYELPVEYEITKASNSEVKEAEKMIKRIKKEKPYKINTCKVFLADRGYDSTKLIEMLDEEEIAPVIDIRNMWKSGEKTKQYRDTDLVYTYDGKVYYVNEKAEKIELLNKGYDNSSKSIRYGFHPKYKDSRIFRISLKEDRRIFTRIPRNTYKWKRIYKKRTGIERINGRIDRDYGFENHTIRGIEKLKMFIGLTFLVSLTLAKSKIEIGNKNHISALVS
jgi:hypothetical protein